MDEECETPNLQPGSEGLLTAFSAHLLPNAKSIFSTYVLCVYRWHFSAFVDSHQGSKAESGSL